MPKLCTFFFLCAQKKKKTLPFAPAEFFLAWECSNATRICCNFFAKVFKFKFNPNGGTYSSNQIEIQFSGLALPTSNRNCFALGFQTGMFQTGEDRCQIIVVSNSGENVKYYKLNGSIPSNVLYNIIPNGTIEYQFSGFYFV